MSIKGMIIETLRKEVVPALGCTEPVAVALACAKAKELLKFEELIKMEILVSPNIYKNGLSVGIPYTEEVGLLIAGALGLIAGDSHKDLGVLEGIKQEDIKQAYALIQENKLRLAIKDTQEKIYVEVKLTTDGGISKAIINERHNQFVLLERNGEILLNLLRSDQNVKASNNLLYDMRINEIINEIEHIPFEEIEFMLDGLEMNEKIAQEGLTQQLGMGVGITIYENIKKGILSDDLMNNAMMLTAAGSDARMSGATLSVMSSNGSGNHGLTAILPILAYRNKFDVSKEKLARALAISHIITGYIKNYTGRLSALCGCGVAASTGASVGIAWLMGAEKEQLDGVIKNMAANISGMICDGAKVGCALKLATAASTAIQSALLALNGRIVPSKNGIVGETAEQTIRNMGTLSIEGMTITDEVILEIMKGMEIAI